MIPLDLPTNELKGVQIHPNWLQPFEKPLGGRWQERWDNFENSRWIHPLTKYWEVGSAKTRRIGLTWHRFLCDMVIIGNICIASDWTSLRTVQNAHTTQQQTRYKTISNNWIGPRSRSRRIVWSCWCKPEPSPQNNIILNSDPVGAEK